MITSHRDRAYAHIREKMLSGDVTAGARLSEVTLAKEIGISRTPVREAMNQLGVEGLLEQVPRYGTFVRKLDRYELQELYELREMLEGYAAERAAQRITPEQLDELQALCDLLHKMAAALRDAGATEMPADMARRWVMADVAFHMLILRASGSERVAKIVGDFRILTNLCGHQRQNPKEGFLLAQARTWAAHARITRALRRRDGDAAREILRKHISVARRSALLHYDVEALPGSPSLGADWPASVRRMISELERGGGGDGRNRRG